MITKLLNDASRENSLQLNSILSSGIPWLKLDLEGPKFRSEILNDAIKVNRDWQKIYDDQRESWRHPGDKIYYYPWNGPLLFGPKNRDEWLATISSDNNKTDENGSPMFVDEDYLCKKHRHAMDFTWYVDNDHPVRKWANSFLDDDAINIVSYYVLGPQAYYQPHYDVSPGNKWLSKIYAAVTWPDGSEFGFLDWGNMPVQEGDVFLINHYQDPHWVVNHSAQYRIVINIGCDLTKIQDLIKRSFLRR